MTERRDTPLPFRHWTNAERVTASLMRARGATYPAIAAELQRTTLSVRKYLAKHG